MGLINIMEKCKAIRDELREIAPGMHLPENMPRFSVPEDYFYLLPEELLLKINNLSAGRAQRELQTLSPFLGSLPKTNPYIVPAGYFSEIADKVLQLAIAIDPVTPAVPYSVPEGYFEGLAEKITAKAVLQQAEHKEPAPVIRLPRRRPAVWKYLAAAVTCGIIISTALYYHNRHQNFDYQLAKVSDQAIEQYLQNNTGVFDNELLYSNVNTDSTGVVNISNELSSEDIREYLESIADPADSTLN